MPNRCTVSDRGDGYNLTVRTYRTNRYGHGTIFTPYVRQDRTRYLGGTRIGPYELSRQELVDFLELRDVPVEFDDEFYWASELVEELK
jgi:hypothetical protein